MPKQKLIKIGNLEGLKSKIITTTDAEIEKIVEEARKDAKSLLDETLERIKSEINLRIDTIFESAKSMIESEKEGLETEKKREIEVLKRQYIDKVYQLAWEKVVEEAKKQSERYVNLLKKLLTLMKEEVGEEEALLYPLQRDKELIEQLLSELGLPNFRVAGTAEERGLRYSGGIMASSPDGKVWYNYTLERVFEDVKERTYSHVIKLLTK